MSFTNLYYKRTAGTAKACYICYKPTTTVLATINTADFLYTCPAHLSDQGFASLVSPSDVSKVSAEEIAKVKAEWEEKEKKRVKKEKDKAEEKDKDKTEDKDKDKAKDSDKANEESKSPKIPATPSASPPPAHERYTLHRDIFSMRQTKHRRRGQAAQAKELEPHFPVVPRGQVEKF